MTRLVIVPNALRDAINDALDEALHEAPPDAAQDREALYRQLVAFYDEHGYIPDFTVAKS